MSTDILPKKRKKKYMPIDIEKRKSAGVYQVHIGGQVITTKVISSAEDVEQSLKELLLLAKGSGMKHLVALDMEKQYQRNNMFYYDAKKHLPVIEKPIMLMLCCATTCLIIKLSSMDASGFCSISRFLQLQQLTFVGNGIEYCLEELRKSYGITCRNTVDVRNLAATARGDGLLRSYTLEELALSVTTVFPKDEISENCNAAALSDWGAFSLSRAQIDAAAWRAGLCFYIGNKFYGGYCKDF